MEEEPLLDFLLRLREEELLDSEEGTGNLRRNSPELDPRLAEIVELTKWIGDEDPLAFVGLRSLETEPGNPYSRDFSLIHPSGELRGTNLMGRYNLGNGPEDRSIDISDSFWFPYRNLIDRPMEGDTWRDGLPVTRNPGYVQRRNARTRFDPKNAGVYTWDSRDNQLSDTVNHELRHVGSDAIGIDLRRQNDHPFVYREDARLTQNEDQRDYSLSQANRYALFNQVPYSVIRDGISRYNREYNREANRRFDFNSGEDSTSLTGAEETASFLDLLERFAEALSRLEEEN